jgi:hypothetical protein
MQVTPTLVYLHVLLMVFWLGTDIGVFIAGLRFMDPKRSLEERAAVIELGMVIDRYPRICFVAILPVGLQIAYLRGLVPALSAKLLVLAWALSAVWMTAVIQTMRLHGKPAARPWQILERWFRILGFLGFTGLGAAGWAHNLILPGWLAGKLVGFGAICLCALLLESAFAPVAVTFASILTDGSTSEREATLRAHMIRTYVWVLGIYAAVLVCGFLGTVKP